MRSILKKYSPTPEYIRSHKQLGWLKQHLKKPSLWNFNRKSVSKAFAIGLFFAFLPMPFQMLLAAPAAIIVSSNLPISIALVWITNPLTIVPIYYGCYKLGSYLLGMKIEQEFIMSMEYFYSMLGTIWKPFVLGSIVVSIIGSIVGYYSIQGIYRFKIYRRKKRNKLL